MRAFLWMICLVPVLAVGDETPSSQPIKPNFNVSAPTQLALPTPKAAEHSTEESQPASLALTPIDSLKVPSRRTPGKALALSVGATAGLLTLAYASASPNIASLRITANALFFSGVIVGPSIGHLYARDRAHAIKMSAARATALGVGIAGLFMISYSIGEDTRLERLAFPVTMVGASSLAGFILYDLVDSAFVLQRMEAKKRASFSGRPLLMNLPSFGR